MVVEGASVPSPPLPARRRPSHADGAALAAVAAPARPRTTSAGRTDVGRRRSCNEDSFVADDQLSLYVVGDGVGGSARGDVASGEAVAIVHAHVERRRDIIDAFAQRPSPEGERAVAALLGEAVALASRIVHGMGQADPAMRGMSSTLSLVLCAGGLAFICHVGDSRVYLGRAGYATQLTEDHTLTNERRKLGLAPDPGVGRNIITRSVGYEAEVRADAFSIAIQPGDRFLVCSDGLHGYLADGELAHLLPGAPADVANRLVDLANARGGRDNITVVLCEVLPAP